MRKKKLIEQNTALFDQIEGLRKEIKDLGKQLEASKAEIEKLKRENEDLAQSVAETPLENIKEKLSAPKSPFNAADYGAKAIGKIIVEATKTTADLSENAGSNAIEYINLVLGKAEVSKAEILNAVSGETDEKQKKMTIDGLVQKTCDYFEKIQKDSTN